MSDEPEYPTVAWIKARLRSSPVAPRRIDVLAAYIVGSEAQGTARPDSDLDIALVIPPVRGKTSLQFSEEYHSRFTSDQFRPRWDGRVVDIQFFYPDDQELAEYTRIELAPGRSCKDGQQELER